MQIHSPDSLERVHNVKVLGQGPSIWQRIKVAFKDRSRNAALRRKIMRDFEELLAMPDYMLRDMGLTRQMVIEERRNFLLTGSVRRVR